MFDSIIDGFADAGLQLFDIQEMMVPREEKKYSMWQEMGGEYYPTVDAKMTKSLPSGCYKINYDNRQDTYKAVPFKIGSDDAYRFDNSYTDLILTEVKKFWDREEIYKKYGIIHKRGLMLEGPAGNGKSVIITLLIEDILKEDGIVFIINTLREFQSIVEALPIFRKLEQDRKIIVVIEDVDKLITANNRDDSQLLDLLDGKNSTDHQLIIMTSNDTSDLSTALLRPSRVDMRFCIDLPEERIRKEYLQRKGVPEDKLDEYSKKTEGMSFAQLKEVFVGTIILDKNIDDVIDQLQNQIEGTDYLNINNTNIGI